MCRSFRLALPLEILLITASWLCRGLAASDPNERVAAYIHHGINSSTDNSLADTDHDGNADASPVVSVDATSTGFQSIVTGSGKGFASSCQAALWSWKKESESYGSQHGYLATTTVPGGVSSTYTHDDITAGVVGRLTTLCDGYPRAIGSVEYKSTLTSTVSVPPETITQSLPGPFTTPMPCSIGPSDCADLWMSFASSTSASLVFENKTVLAPPCQTATGNTTVPFDKAACTSDGGSNGGVVGSEIRLLYWPVRTAATSSPDPYFCSSYTGSMMQPSYIPGTRTGDGPNTFVTGDLTITSPAVGISFSGLHRRDGCGPTLDHTIVTLQPSQLYSIRGARAAYGWYPFNFADLNWRCESPSGTFTLQDTNETANGAACYQDVAAQAYFGAEPQYEYARGMTTGLTILNNYHPYVSPDQEVGVEMLHSLWGSTASWWIDGIWDPPLALTQASREAVPTMPGGGETETTTTAGDDPILTTPAAPVHTTLSGVMPTALPDSELTTTKSSASAPSGTNVQGSQTVSQSEIADPSDSSPTSVVVPSGEISSQSETYADGDPTHTTHVQAASASTTELAAESQGAFNTAASATSNSAQSDGAPEAPTLTASHGAASNSAGPEASSMSGSTSDSTSNEGSSAATSENSAGCTRVYRDFCAILVVVGVIALQVDVV